MTANNQQRAVSREVKSAHQRSAKGAVVAMPKAALEAAVLLLSSLGSPWPVGGIGVARALTVHLPVGRTGAFLQ